MGTSDLRRALLARDDLRKPRAFLTYEKFLTQRTKRTMKSATTLSAASLFQPSIIIYKSPRRRRVPQHQTSSSLQLMNFMTHWGTKPRAAKPSKGRHLWGSGLRKWDAWENIPYWVCHKVTGDRKWSGSAMAAWYSWPYWGQALGMAHPWDSRR